MSGCAASNACHLTTLSMYSLGAVSIAVTSGSKPTSDSPDVSDDTDTPNGSDSMRRPDSVCDHGSVPDDRPRERRPPSQRVEADMRARLTRGEWQSGDRLPPVAELAAHYQVARSTVISALRRIEADELIEIVPNWGTFRR
jgi:hypothetical protein